MDDNKTVYFNADHHDCLVGASHCGMVTEKQKIMSGEYLSTTNSFFTYKGAARLKTGMVNLPQGMVKGIGAAPLDNVPDGVNVDWIVVVANPHNANQIAGCRVMQDGFCPMADSVLRFAVKYFQIPGIKKPDHSLWRFWRKNE